LLLVLTRECAKEYAYFFFYSLVRTSYSKRLAARRPAGSPAVPLSTVAELALGAIAGILAQIFTIPVSVIATRQQLGVPQNMKKGKGKGGEGDGEDDDGSFLAIAREIVREEGVTGLWLGLKPGLVLTVNPAITYGLFERIKGAVLAARERVGNTSPSLGPGLSFALGATSKSLATVVRVSMALVGSTLFIICIPCIGNISVYNGQGSHPDAQEGRRRK
jgi:solute carrier family 25 (peroxisomal adenine nucleotide transporter), member 17